MGEDTFTGDYSAEALKALADALHHVGQEHRKLEARALLLRSNDLLQPGFGATDEEREQHAKEIRAFLAEPQKL